MEYLDNTEITVDAILTKKGREKQNRWVSILRDSH